MKLIAMLKLSMINYANPNGRASRSELFCFSLLYTLLVTFGGGFFAPVGAFIAFLLLPPLFCLAVRRLHDIGTTGWWLLAIYIFCWAFLPLLVFLIPGDQGPNKYGDRAEPSAGGAGSQQRGRQSENKKSRKEVNRENKSDNEKKKDNSGAREESESRSRNEAYMTIEEALDILGLDEKSSMLDVQMAFRNLMKRMHPDLGGSPYFAKKSNIARDVLLSRPQKAA